MTTTKYQIIEVDAQTLNCTILATFYEYPDAIAHLNNFVEKTFDLGSSFKCHHDSSTVLSIYQYYYLFPKQLVCKYFIIPYIDIIEEI